MACETFACTSFETITAPLNSLEATMFGALSDPTRDILSAIGGVLFALFWLMKFAGSTAKPVEYMDSVGYLGRIVFAFMLMGTQDLWILILKAPVHEMITVLAGGIDSLGSEIDLRDGTTGTAAMVDQIALNLVRPLDKLDETLSKAKLNLFDGDWWVAMWSLTWAKILTSIVGMMVFAVALLFRLVEAIFFGMAPFLALTWAFVRTEIIATIALRVYIGASLLIALFAIAVGTLKSLGSEFSKKLGATSSGIENDVEATIDPGVFLDAIKEGIIGNYAFAVGGVIVALVVLTMIVIWGSLIAQRVMTK